MIKIYSKKNCKFCVLSKELLLSENLEFIEYDLTSDGDLKEKIMEKTSKFNHKTFPFVFRSEEFIGGFKELKCLIENGFLNENENDFF